MVPLAAKVLAQDQMPVLHQLIPCTDSRVILGGGYKKLKLTLRLNAYLSTSMSSDNSPYLLFLILFHLLCFFLFILIENKEKGGFTFPTCGRLGYCSYVPVIGGYSAGGSSAGGSSAGGGGSLTVISRIGVTT